ncbi:hypothetical protein QTP88_007773 [Uroleucon formosanum]
MEKLVIDVCFLLFSTSLRTSSNSYGTNNSWIPLLNFNALSVNEKVLDGTLFQKRPVSSALNTCSETVAVFKEYNVKRHYETKHNDYLKFSSEVKQSKLREFTSQLKTQQKMFSSALQQPSNIVKASYSVSFLIAKKMKKFSDGEFVKECLEAVVKDILPDKNKLFSNISSSRKTVCRRINDISNEIIVKLRDRIQDFKYFSIAFDESTDISDTAQLVIFVRGVNESFQITEEMLKLISLKGTT